MRKPIVVIACVAIAVVALALIVGGFVRGAYVGSAMSHTFHDRSCIWAEEMSRENRVWFSTAEEARSAGYEPCGVCEPSD